MPKVYGQAVIPNAPSQFPRYIDGVGFPIAPDSAVELDTSELTEAMVSDQWVHIRDEKGNRITDINQPAATKAVKAGGK